MGYIYVNMFTIDNNTNIDDLRACIKKLPKSKNKLFKVHFTNVIFEADTRVLEYMETLL